MALIPVAVSVLVGIGIGLLTGGRLSSLRRFRVHGPAAIVLVIGCGIALDHYSPRGASLIAILGMGAAAVVAVRNVHLTGIFVVSVGIVANLLPVAANGDIPVRSDALVEAGIVTESDLGLATLSGSRRFADQSTILSTLGDTIPIGLTNQVVSFGDLILLVGLVDLMANATHRQRRRPRRNARWKSTTSSNDQATAITRARPVHDWGDAPSPRPVSPFQYSARPEAIAPRTTDRPIASANTDSSVRSLLESATHSK